MKAALRQPFFIAYTPILLFFVLYTLAEILYFTNVYKPINFLNYEIKFFLHTLWIRFFNYPNDRMSERRTDH